MKNPGSELTRSPSRGFFVIAVKNPLTRSTRRGRKKKREEESAAHCIILDRTPPAQLVRRRLRYVIDLPQYTVNVYEFSEKTQAVSSLGESHGGGTTVDAPDYGKRTTTTSRTSKTRKRPMTARRRRKRRRRRRNRRNSDG